MKNKLLIGIFSFVSLFGFAQSEVEALRYSFLTPSGTARFSAMGGSFGALGADPSVVGFNPAGMGVYRSSQFTFTPVFNLVNSSSNFLGSNSTDYNFNFKFDNLAYIGSININKDENSVKAVNFGISYNKLADFNSNILISGKNTYNSMTDWFASRASGTDYRNLQSQDNFFSHLAWEAYLIDQNLPDTMSYVSAFGGIFGQTQRQFIGKTGSLGQYDFATAINIENKLFLGASLGIQSISFTQKSTLSEIDEDNLIADFKSFNFIQYQNTSGSGINFKLGALFSPVNWIRFGGAIHTPTVISMKLNYYNSVKSVFESAEKSKEIDSKRGYFDYQLVTPFRANASLGFIIAKTTLLNVDYEFVDYSLSRLRSDNYGFFNENDNIRAEYKPAHNLKLGLEYKIGNIRLRAGGAYFDSPYKTDHINQGSYALLVSGGIGVFFENLYLDFAYSNLMSKEVYYMYEGYGVNSPATDIKLVKNSLITTIGFRF